MQTFRRTLLLSSILLIISVLSFTSCKKIDIDENATLQFSSSQITFDTIFTTVGSTTQRLTVYNKHDFPVKVDVILAGGSASLFSMNVDGVACRSIEDVEIAAHDSMFVHVKVTINPGNQNTPFLVTDSIIFRVGTREQDVDLLAFGQDAHFIIADSWLGSSINYKVVAAENEVVHWTAEKPYVIYGWAVVDSMGTLIVEPGTQVFLHSASGLWVYRYGNIQVNGTAESPVRFCGDRKEAWYDTDYAQWDRIWLSEGSRDNLIEYAEITNAFIGIQIAPLQESTLNNNIIRNTTIHNTSGSGILARASKMQLINSQISNNGACGLQLEIGDYDIKHVTVANYFTQSVRKNPAVYVSNQYSDGTTRFVGDVYAHFYNSIIYGNAQNELTLSQFDDETLDFSALFDHCIVKTPESRSEFVDCQRNVDPLFTDARGQDYTLRESSPAIDAGKVGVGVSNDISGKPREGVPDVGAFEF